MEWYYAANDERRGPVPASEIASLVTAGKISRQTLVWKQGMAEWKTAGDAGLFTEANTPPDSTSLTCIITGRTFPASQMLKTEHGWVSAEGKNTYYQALREGGPIPVAMGQTNAVARGKFIVVPATNARLPMRCVKTNQPVTEDDIHRKALYWCTPAIYFALLLNLIVVIILNYVLRKKVMVDIPLSKVGRRIVTRNIAIMWTAILGGLFTFFVGVTSMDGPNEDTLILLAPIGMLAFLAGLIFGNRKACALRVAKLKNGEAWLAGASKEYIASLPAS